jgi:hypothetical protein
MRMSACPSSWAISGVAPFEKSSRSRLRTSLRMALLAVSGVSSFQIRP